MYKGKKILALIPARGGSKGLPGKNIKPLLGKPLIAWTIDAAKKSKYLDRLILSSDDAKIIGVARKWGCEAPFIRPKNIAKDDTPHIEPIMHAIRTLPEKYDFIVMLQPTSPLRLAEDIDGCIKQCIDGHRQSCVSVTKADKSPLWMYRLGKNGLMSSLLKLKKIPMRRQNLPKVYILNGAVYVADCKKLLKSRAFLVPRTYAFEMPGERSVDIDTELDIIKTEAVIRSKLVRISQ